MDRDDFLKDDFLKELVGKQPLESPSDDFTEKVMAGIRMNPELTPEGKPYYLYLKASWPYLLIALTVIIYLASSDLPFSKFIPGKEYFESFLFPYLKNLSADFITLFSFIKSATLPMAILSSGLLLFILDRFFFRRRSVQHYFNS